MAPKRKRASSPGVDIRKRQRKEEEAQKRDTEHTNALNNRASRRKTITAVTPLRDVHISETILQRAPKKKQYGRHNKARLGPVGESNDEVEDEDGDGEETTKPTVRVGKQKDKRMPETPAKPPVIPATKSAAQVKPRKSVFDDKTPSRTRRGGPVRGSDPALILEKLSLSEIKRVSEQHQFATEPSSKGGETDPEESQPTPCPPRMVQTSKTTPRGRQSIAKPLTKSSKIEGKEKEPSKASRSQRTPGKLTSKPVADLGDLMDERLRKATKPSGPKRSLAHSQDPTSDDDSDLDTPIKPARKSLPNVTVSPIRLVPKTRTPKAAPGSTSRSQLGTTVTPARRPPARPKKGRPSYTATVKKAPALNLGQTEAQSRESSVGRKDARLADTVVRSTPAPETDIECSGTEANFSPASVRAFAETSSPLADLRYSEDEDEDTDRDVVIDETTMPVSPPTSPSKSVLPKTLPGHLQRFVEPQRRVLMKSLRAPAFIDIASPLLDDKAPVEATAFQQLCGLLRGTCERGEGNSCLLLGSRRGGKSSLIDAALQSCSNNPIIVRLSGHTQTTDRLAMREIAYQLSHQTDAVFNIPDEEEDDQEKSDEPGTGEEVNFTPPAAHLPALISQLTSLKRPVVVVLDAFDLFTSQPRQALLYCLLDTVQSCRAGEGRNGLLVVGASCVVNCVNYLEKRVKSRFSHRILKVANPSTLEQYTNIARTLLTAPFEERSSPEKRGKAARQEWENLWSTSVEAFLAHKTTTEVLANTFAFRRDIGNLACLLTKAAIQLNDEHLWLDPQSLSGHEPSSQLPEHFEFLHRLPQASMWILTALYHWGTAGHEIVNLKMVLDACAKAATFQDGFRLVVNNANARGVNNSSVMAPAMLQTAFEELVRLRVLQPVSGPSNSLSQEFVKYKCMVDRESLRKVVEKNGSTAVKDWLVTPGVMNS